MIGVACGPIAGALAAAVLRYIESRNTSMSDIQDAAPSSTEPQAPVGESTGGASVPAVTESSGTTAQTTGTPSIPTGETQTIPPSDSQSPSITNEGGTTAEAGNQPGQADSADTATSTQDAPLSPATADAVATFADMMDRFETKTYADGSTVRTIGELPSDSVVTYPDRLDPVDDSPLGWCNQLDQFIVKATGSSRTDGNKLVAKLRAYLESNASA